MTRRILAVLTLTAAGILAGCGTDTKSCAASSATWNSTTNNCDSIKAGQAFDVDVTICQLDCQSTPSCAVDVQGGTIQLDAVVHTCDESSCGISSCAANPKVTCHVPGLEAGSYALLVGTDPGGSIDVTGGGSDTSCHI